MSRTTFQSHWKNSINVPHHKNGPTHAAENFRLINHTPVLSWLKEKLLNTVGKLPHYSQLCHPLQTRIPKGPILTHLSIWFLEPSQPECWLPPVDTRNRFRHVKRVWPHFLLPRMARYRKYGIRTTPFPWLSPYLSNCFQVVNNSSCFAQSCAITRGVIQGRILNYLLSLPYISYVLQAFPEGTPLLFDDDSEMVHLLKQVHSASRMHVSTKT